MQVVPISGRDDAYVASHSHTHKTSASPTYYYSPLFFPFEQEKHLPGYLAALPQFKAKGVSKVAVLAVNDFFTMKAWGKEQKVPRVFGSVEEAGHACAHVHIHTHTHARTGKHSSATPSPSSRTATASSPRRWTCSST